MWVLLRRHPSWGDRLADVFHQHDHNSFFRAIAYLASLHDVGKISETFQSKVPAIASWLDPIPSDESTSWWSASFSRGTSFYHDGATYALIHVSTVGDPSDIDDLPSCYAPRLDDSWSPFDDPRGARHLLAPIFCHHGYPPRFSYQDSPEKTVWGVEGAYDYWCPYGGRQDWYDDPRQSSIGRARQLMESLRTVDLFEDATIDRIRDHDQPRGRGSWLLAGLMILSDWLGSQVGPDQPFDYLPHTPDDFESHADEVDQLQTYWTDQALPSARDAVEASGICPTEIHSRPESDPGFSHLFDDATPWGLTEGSLQTWADAPSVEGDLSQTEPSIHLDHGLYVIEGQTGSGKTEAALTLVDRLVQQRDDLHGLYWALPTKASSNSMLRRMHVLNEWFDKGDEVSFTLAHSDPEESQFYQYLRDRCNVSGVDRPRSALQCQSWIEDSSKRALLAQIGVGTVDQLLMSTLKKRHSTLRWLGLTSTAIVIDEVHSYDIYQRPMLKRLLEQAGRCDIPVILLSATLSRAAKEDLLPAYQQGNSGANFDPVIAPSQYPLMTSVPRDPAQDPCRYPPEGYNLPPVESQRDIRWTMTSDQRGCLDRLLETARQGGCAVWVRNTVPNAYEIYRTLCNNVEHDDDIDVMLVHSRWTQKHRREFEHVLQSRYGPPTDSQSGDRSGTIVISTQVIEQSLDLDFDVMVTDLAPIDLLLQRIGRWRRHDRDRPDLARDVLVFHEAEDPCPSASNVTDDWWSSLIYEHCDDILWKTARVVETYPCVQVPSQIRHVIEQVYGEEADTGPDGIRTPENLREASYKRTSVERDDRETGRSRTIEWDRGWAEVGGPKWKKATPTRSIELASYAFYMMRPRTRERCRLVPWHSTWNASKVTISEHMLGGSYQSGDDPEDAPSTGGYGIVPSTHAYDVIECRKGLMDYDEFVDQLRRDHWRTPILVFEPYDLDTDQVPAGGVCRMPGGVSLKYDENHGLIQV